MNAASRNLVAPYPSNTSILIATKFTQSLKTKKVLLAQNICGKTKKRKVATGFHHNVLNKVLYEKSYHVEKDFIKIGSALTR